MLLLSHTPAAASTERREVLPIFPDDDAPVREGYKVPLAAVDADAPYAYAFFPDSTYGATDEAHAAAVAWLNGPPPDEDDTLNIVRIEIPEVEEEVPDDAGGTKVIKTRRATYGWQVRMQRQGKAYTQFFNDNHFGGRTGALKAAQYWRTWRDQSLTKTDPREAIERSRMTRSQFGVPGLRVLLIDVGGRYNPYLQASWPEKGPDGKVRRKRKTLSLVKHDPRKATIKLCQALVRARWEGALQDDDLPDDSSPFSILDAPEDEPRLDTEVLESGLQEFEAAMRKEAEAFKKKGKGPGSAYANADAAQREAQREAFRRFYQRALPAVEGQLPDLLRKAEELSTAKA